MKLRNKKTGEICTLTLSSDGETMILMNERMYKHSIKLKDLEEWEDVPEEPKEYWYVSCDGRALKVTTDDDDYNEKHNTGHKQIGNYFETKEEAERVVENLKAWKRLKDKEFEFVGCFKDNTINFEFVGHPLSYDEGKEAEQDLAYIFGGEE